jgi:hypothetical protein
MSTPAATTLAHIQALIEHGGQIMLGTARPIAGAAVAHDGKQTLAMLKRQPGESVELLLHRLDDAIGIATRTGVRIDEINKPKANVRYEYK